MYTAACATGEGGKQMKDATSDVGGGDDEEMEDAGSSAGRMKMKKWKEQAPIRFALALLFIRNVCRSLYTIRSRCTNNFTFFFLCCA